MDYSVFVKQLDPLLDLHSEMQRTSQHNDLSDLSKTDRQGLVTRSVAAIDRIAGPRSSYSNEVKRIISAAPALHNHTSAVLGVVQALRDDLNSGYMQTFAEIVHADIFSDFLDMAQHLNETGYKDAAAVIAGSTLESHLRKLAVKNALSIVDAHGKPMKADQMNADLAKAGIYGVLDQKSITAQLDLRNKAAHGKYSEYTKEQVSNLISGITEFLKRTPA